MYGSVFSGEFFVNYDAFGLKSKYRYKSDMMGFIVWWLLWLDDAFGFSDLKTRSSSCCLVRVNGETPTSSEVSELDPIFRIRSSSFSVKEKKEDLKTVKDDLHFFLFPEGCFRHCVEQVYKNSLL